MQNLTEDQIRFLNNFKTIDEFNNFSVNFSGLMDKLNENPSLYYGLLGGAGGAGIGAGANLIFGNKKKSNLRKLIEGALIGGVLGSGAGAIGGGLFKGQESSAQGDASTPVPTKDVNTEKPVEEDQVVDDKNRIIFPPVGTVLGGAMGATNIKKMAERNAKIIRDIKDDWRLQKSFYWKDKGRTYNDPYLIEHSKALKKAVYRDAGAKDYAFRGRRVAGVLLPVVAGVGTDVLANWALNGD